MARRDAKRILWAAASLMLVLAAAAAAPVLRRRLDPPPPVLGRLPAFSLTERSGRSVTRESLAGRVWVADFIFTSCAGLCPAMTARMARLQAEVPQGTRLVSFTVDPEHDSPEVLTRYAEGFQAGEEWLFVTGRKADLYNLAVDGFKLAAMEVPADQQRAGGDGPFLHSGQFVLVDERGQVRGYYDSKDEGAVLRLVRDARRLRS